jgi:ribosome-associated translation inhibitor RaiA
MQIQYQLRGLDQHAVTERLFEQRLKQLDQIILISTALVVLEHQPNASPPFSASVEMAVPGPDIHAAARDHTLEAVVLKVVRRLEDQVGARKSHQELRSKRWEHSRAGPNQWNR